MQTVLDGIAAGSGLTIESRDAAPVATAMVVVLTYWLSFEYVRDPRRALEPETASAALSRGAFHVLCLLLPYLCWVFNPAVAQHMPDHLALP